MCTLNGFIFRSEPEIKLNRALELTDKIIEDTISEIKICDDKSLLVKVKTNVQGASGAGLFAKVSHKPKLQVATEKAKTTEADVRKELKRGSMKEKWGLSLAYRIDGAKISLLGMFS